MYLAMMDSMASFHYGNCMPTEGHYITMMLLASHDLYDERCCGIHL